MVTIRGLMKALSITNLRKTYDNGTEALKGINFSVDEGDFYALLGPNGAGKTTAIGVITSLVNKSGGDVEIFSHNIDTELEAAWALEAVGPHAPAEHVVEVIEDLPLQGQLPVKLIGEYDRLLRL